MPLSKAFMLNFLGNSPKWYKTAIITFLIINPIVFFAISPFVAGWLLVAEFIFTLAMALKCYPLQPGGLLAIQAIAIGMTTPGMVLHEMEANMEVILLLIFMVAGIYFMKELLLYVFTKLITKLRSKVVLSVAFCAAGAILSAFLDALTVIAVIISVVIGFYSVYHKVSSGKGYHHDHDHTHDRDFHEQHRQDLQQFRGFLRNLLMHAGVGTALGGVMTKVGEPQNLIIAEKANWEFIEFAIRMSPVTIPVFFCGLATCMLVEKMGWFSYGVQLPKNVYNVLADYAKDQDQNRTQRETAKLIIQGIIALWLVIGLAFHFAAVGLIGLSVIVLATAFNGVTEEHALGKAFEEALPFTALLGVFFAVVAVIIDQGLFTPVINWVLTYEGTTQMVMFYMANGLLSMVSDNVFVGTVYIEQISTALKNGQITRDQFDMLAVAINTGTNLPSVATPNGQAAFLFLLTSALAPLIRLSYGRMVFMALPYTIVLSIVGFLMIQSGFLDDMTAYYYDAGLIHHHSASEVSDSSSGGH
ncbi:sodium/proton antiporter NhaB [Psychrobium sp. 1_MG-2023]|uniref:sodium/proton antiporter NhaB n=1 Tax=Psychrobium sp. 1_MG-2023 TaxID=3062624 RepID=UPI000C34456F|nr:sodium/proton antiporter NhaB [Psychrobium sp. 1_MG-2023]MDP2562203.1 sodium/proton antiporter NhaB [Psychrobium sp. 1_MG-2023]PKF58129.1 sodium/proton antiporter [Alteromonadales bacterium alter-6D02]